jgi:gliding motility-associated protein GldC
MSRTAEIRLTVELDDQDLPTQIDWQASEAREPGAASAQAMLLSLWDSENKSTAAIDLWTKDMTIDDMNLYFYQVIHKMADSYLRASRNDDMARLIHEFGDAFDKKLGMLRNDIDPRDGEGPVDLISLADDHRQRSAK